jgi:hypothetical protein
MTKKPPPFAWKSVSEYVDFAREHNVFGAEAVKLKQQMDKIQIPEPEIKQPDFPEPSTKEESPVVQESLL